MKVNISLVVALLSFIAVPMFARDYQTYTTYYDEEGNQVGYFFINCNYGSGHGGVSTDLYTTEFTPCQSEVEPIFCPNADLHSTNCWDYCVTDGYYLWASLYGSDPFGCI